MSKAKSKQIRHFQARNPANRPLPAYKTDISSEKKPPNLPPVFLPPSSRPDKSATFHSKSALSTTTPRPPNLSSGTPRPHPHHPASTFLRKTPPPSGPAQPFPCKIHASPRFKPFFVHFSSTSPPSNPESTARKAQNSSKKSRKSATNLSFPQSNSPSIQPCATFPLQNTRLNAVQTLFCLFLRPLPLRPLRSALPEKPETPQGRAPKSKKIPSLPCPAQSSPCKKAAQTRPCNASLSGRGRKLPKRGM